MQCLQATRRRPRLGSPLWVEHVDELSFPARRDTGPPTTMPISAVITARARMPPGNEKGPLPLTLVG